MSKTDSDYDAVIVGAGFSGLYALHALRGLGLSCRLFEAGDGVGGTWYWNRYPGARCDSESHFYCFSFSDELLQEWNWTERFPSQPEILRYLNFAADKLDLRRDIQLNTKVTAAVYYEETELWAIASERGEAVTARYFITAIGALSTANVPSIEGLDSFAGQWYHTGDWPREGVDLTGKRVGVIGTGSTGTQLIPVVAEQAGQLTVFQRTPNFSMPARNMPLDPDFMKQVKATYPEMWAKARNSAGGMPLPPPDKSFAESTPEEARQRYEAGWARGGVYVLQQFNDLTTSQASNDFAADFVREKIREKVDDPATAARLLPTGYPIATKRPVLDSNYFETYNRPNVRLVDLREVPITRITAEGVVTGDTVHELDVLIFATGFDAMTGPFFAIDIRGRGGLRLRDKWAAGPRSYLGYNVAGFPNMLIITGPCSPSVLTNMPVTIELDVEWIADCIRYLEENQVTSIEATEEAEDGRVRHVAEKVEGTLYPLANSWWLGANIPGKPRVFMAYVGGLNRHHEHCVAVAEAGYEGFTLTSRQAAGPLPGEPGEEALLAEVAPGPAEGAR